MRLNLIISILSLFVMVSCKSGKLQKKGVNLGERSEQSDSTSLVTKADLEINSFDFQQIRFKSDVDIASQAFSQKFPMTIHVQKNEIIWASVSIGLEIARAKITQDSLIFMDRFNRKSYQGTWTELSRASGFELNFNTLQSMLVGDLLFDIETMDQLQSGSAYLSVLQQRNGLNFESKIDNEVHRLYELKGIDPKSNTELSLNFKSFVTESERLIPSVISMLLSGKSNTRLDIKHSRIEFLNDGLSFSFSVPASYKVEKLPGI